MIKIFIELNIMQIVKKYEGEFKEDKEHGKGKCYDINGNLLYEGDIEFWYYYIGEKRIKKEGKGIMYYCNGKINYEGEFKNGYLRGKVKLYDINDNLLFKGNFSDDLYYIGEKKVVKKMEKELNIIWIGKLFIKEISLMKKEREKANLIIIMIL